MKKIYTIPAVKEVKVNIEHHICTGSDKIFGVGDKKDEDLVPTAKEDDFGW